MITDVRWGNIILGVALFCATHRSADEEGHPGIHIYLHDDLLHVVFFVVFLIL